MDTASLAVAGRLGMAGVLCAGALIGSGCGPDAIPGSNAVVGPTAVAAETVSPSPPPPPTAAPTPPPRSLPVDLTGYYALTFEVGSACEQVPKELRIRTYEARIQYDRSYGSTDSFLALLSGATSYQTVLIDVSGDAVSLDLSDNVILEEPSPGGYLATAGYGVAFVQPTELSTISGSFTGYFKYCAGSENQCSVDAMVRGMCKSENSRWTLTRR